MRYLLAFIISLAPVSLAQADTWSCAFKCYTDFERFSLMCQTANHSDLTQCYKAYDYCLSTCWFKSIGGCAHSCRQDLAMCLNIAADAYGQCTRLVIRNANQCLNKCGMDGIE